MPLTSTMQRQGTRLPLMAYSFCSAEAMVAPALALLVADVVTAMALGDDYHALAPPMLQLRKDTCLPGFCRRILLLLTRDQTLDRAVPPRRLPLLHPMLPIAAAEVLARSRLDPSGIAFYSIHATSLPSRVLVSMRTY